MFILKEKGWLMLCGITARNINNVQVEKIYANLFASYNKKYRFKIGCNNCYECRMKTNI